jgi:hypothetical protein
MSAFWNKALLGVAVGALSLISAQSAFADDPLMGRSPWNFQPEDRAGIAVIMKNVESGFSASGPGAIICGGTSGASGQGATGSGASSTANSSCIIVNGSPGTQINNPQHSDGNQSSSSSASSKTTNNNGGSDAVSSILNGNKQGL